MTAILCDRCGHALTSRACKDTCSRCGSRMDCSDLTLWLDERVMVYNSYAVEYRKDYTRSVSRVIGCRLR